MPRVLATHIIQVRRLLPPCDSAGRMGDASLDRPAPDCGYGLFHCGRLEALGGREEDCVPMIDSSMLRFKIGTVLGLKPACRFVLNRAFHPDPWLGTIWRLLYHVDSVRPPHKVHGKARNVVTCGKVTRFSTATTSWLTTPESQTPRGAQRRITSSPRLVRRGISWLAGWVCLRNQDPIVTNHHEFLSEDSDPTSSRFTSQRLESRNSRAVSQCQESTIPRWSSEQCTLH